MVCIQRVQGTQTAKLPSLTLVLPKPEYSNTYVNNYCFNPQTCGIECQPGFLTTTTPNQQTQVIYSIQGSGYLLGSLVELLIDEVQLIRQVYSQVFQTLNVKPKSKVSMTISPPPNDTTHCSVSVNVVPRQGTTQVFIQLGNIVNRTTIIKVIGNYESLSGQCISCPG